MKKFSVVVLALLLSGCGTYYTSGVAPVTGGTSSEVVKNTASFRAGHTCDRRRFSTFLSCAGRY
jgi:hypothetical protein